MVDKLFIAAFISELGVPRLVVGAKDKGDTLKDFLDNRAISVIQKSPINKFDAVSNYRPLVYAEVEIGKAREVRDKDLKTTKENKENLKKCLAKQYEPIASEESMALYLQSKGWVCYKRKQRK